jgi:hypothetical protein
VSLPDLNRIPSMMERSSFRNPLRRWPISEATKAQLSPSSRRTRSIGRAYSKVGVQGPMLLLRPQFSRTLA